MLWSSASPVAGSQIFPWPWSVAAGAAPRRPSLRSNFRFRSMNLIPKRLFWD